MNGPLDEQMGDMVVVTKFDGLGIDFYLPLL